MKSSFSATSVVWRCHTYLCGRMEFSSCAFSRWWCFFDWPKHEVHKSNISILLSWINKHLYIVFQNTKDSKCFDYVVKVTITSVTVTSGVIGSIIDQKAEEDNCFWTFWKVKKSQRLYFFDWQNTFSNICILEKY